MSQLGCSSTSPPTPKQAATSEERDELLEEATDAVLSSPMLFDLVEALPEWETYFGALATDVCSFVRSPEFNRRAISRRAGLSILEVRHGVLVRIPRAEDCSAETLAEALQAVDGRAVSAIVSARLLHEGHSAALVMKDQVSKSYGAFKQEEAERFLLTAVAALPRGALEILDVLKEAVQILASGYLRLERPTSELLATVFDPVYEGLPCLRSALKLMGLQFGVKIDLSRPTVTTSRAAVESLSAEDVAGAVKQQVLQGEVKFISTDTVRLLRNRVVIPQSLLYSHACLWQLAFRV